MKITNQIIVLILFLFLPVFLMAQDLDEILEKHIEAHGGIKNWEKIENIKFNGVFTAFSEEKEYMAIKTKSGEYYADQYLGHIHVIEAFNGESGWTIDPWQEMSFPRRLNKPEINVFYQKAEFFSPFYKYKEKGYTAEYLGLQDIEGSEMHALKLTRPNGYEETWYLDTETYLAYKCESMWVDFAGRVPCETYFDNFRQVNGVIIPFYTERIFGQRNRMIVVENVEINAEVNKDLFEMPVSTAMAKIDFLVGEWDVAVHRMSRRRGWLTWGNVTSSTVYKLDKLIEESIDYEIEFARILISNFSYDQQSEIYRLTVFNDLNSSTEIYQGAFEGEELILKTIQLGDKNAEDEIYSQIKITEISENGFTVVKSLSRDKENWFDQEKLVYTKMN